MNTSEIDRQLRDTAMSSALKWYSQSAYQGAMATKQDFRPMTHQELVDAAESFYLFLKGEERKAA